MNNSRSNVYRGDFCKSVKACEFTHVSVFMRTRRADSRFAAYRILRRFQTGNAGAYDLVCMPAKRDSGSLHWFSKQKIYTKYQNILMLVFLFMKNL
jgi:Tat protein secretion system quality control protein TatD with DNase activity